MSDRSLAKRLTDPPAAPILPVLSDEGFRLFFPLAALHIALWPFLWVALWSLRLPFAVALPQGLWHGSEMILGAWGAVLIGFMTTAAPEWTDTKRLQGRALWRLAALWGVARLAGLLGIEPMLWLSLLADLGWMLLLLGYLLRLTVQRRTDRLLPFIGWIAALIAGAAVVRFGMASGQVELAQRALVLAGLIFMGILGLAISRIAVPVANHVLDPSEETVPFRPHPGRMNLAPGLVALALAGELSGLSTAVTGWLWIAAGAAFMDRVGEGFLGRASFRTEVLSLMASAGFAGLGLIALGASRLGAPWSEVPALHLAVMGGIGMGVISVFAIVGKFHTGQKLGQGPLTRLACLSVAAGVLLRTLPEMGLMPWPPGPDYLLASLFWAAGYLLWLIDTWRDLIDPETMGSG
ncbi:NnrS family protein [Pararhodobacter oceanensis]|uniref:Short-chain dehydrogenase n=1 Tax=Pararhodobacter oceanensis TaxID=2172121 RepID=A0A2T8HPT1_9RHOB|nr:NnrS family protein [Pararhodobacter oceanensis]PVH27430.1 short-chain dehydrogenase [Pararhodobacter oceanensis]